MSRENVDLLRRGFDAWNRDDLAAVLALLSQDFEFRPDPDYFDLEPVYRGHDGFRAFGRSGGMPGSRSRFASSGWSTWATAPWR
jgi:ketosteroid isomerase-like protein